MEDTSVAHPLSDTAPQRDMAGQRDALGSASSGHWSYFRSYRPMDCTVASTWLLNSRSSSPRWGILLQVQRTHVEGVEVDVVVMRTVALRRTGTAVAGPPEVARSLLDAMAAGKARRQHL